MDDGSTGSSVVGSALVASNLPNSPSFIGNASGVRLGLVVGTIRLVGSNANNAFSSVASSLQ
jgi:hypothetical protein